jgi:hypothetical protein
VLGVQEEEEEVEKQGTGGGGCCLKVVSVKKSREGLGAVSTETVAVHRMWTSTEALSRNDSSASVVLQNFQGRTPDQVFALKLSHLGYKACV